MHSVTLRDRYWLRTVSSRASQHVRYFIVGTKVDQITGSWDDAMKKLQVIKGDMRSVVTSCCGPSALEMTSFLFVTAMGTHPQYARLRKELKGRLKLMCKSIFEGDAQLLKTLRFPKEYTKFKADIQKLPQLRPGLPILDLESVSGAEYGLLVGSHTNAQSLQALSVLHDVGEIIFCHLSDGKGGSKACLCWQPQVIADVIAMFADPEAGLPIVRGCASRGNLQAVLIQYLQKQQSSEQKMQSSEQRLHEDSNMLFEFLLALRVFTRVERPVADEAARAPDSSIDDHSVQFMVPSSLQGRPSFWREVFDSQVSSFSCIRGVRYFCMDSMITVAAFVRAMTHLCSDPARMWGCAFSFPLSNGSLVFVRLSESRDFVDVVVLGSDLSQLAGESVESSMRKISTLLRCSSSNTLPLCPHCCASDMFARSGAVHAFFRQQLALLSSVDQQELADDDAPSPALSDDLRGLALDESIVSGASARSVGRIMSGGGAGCSPTISCSRYHRVSESSVLMGHNVGSVGGAGMPVSFPEASAAARDALGWVAVSNTGLADTATAEAEVMPNSFFSLTQQLVEGDMISAASLAVIHDSLQSGAKHCRVSRRGPAASGAWSDVDVCLEYAVGHSIGGAVIDVILSCSGTVEVSSALASSGAVTTKRPHCLSCGDEVLLSVAFDSDGTKVEGVPCVVTQVVKDDQLILTRKQPGCAAQLPLAANVSIMPVRDRFTPLHNVLVVYKRPNAANKKFDVFPGSSNGLRVMRLFPSDCSRSAQAAECWRDVEDNWAIMLGNEFRNYEITGITLFRCEERERLFLDEVNHLKRISPHRPHADFSCATDKSGAEQEQRSALQQQVMGHFSDFSQKFSLLPNAESKDVNLCVAWWGKWPSVYYGAAQNGFWNLPSHLKIDPGYFGEGFYLTRYPRYSDYYVNGFSLSKRVKEDRGSILMCYAALGRPYPVTQDPFCPPLYTQGAPSASSPCGKACGAACGFSSSGGIDTHDCHYVTVKMHAGAGQYFPCPVRQQPDFDEIVVFNAKRILASASITFQRR